MRFLAALSFSWFLSSCATAKDFKVTQKDGVNEVIFANKAGKPIIILSESGKIIYNGYSLGTSKDVSDLVYMMTKIPNSKKVEFSQCNKVTVIYSEGDFRE